MCVRICAYLRASIAVQRYCYQSHSHAMQNVFLSPLKSIKNISWKLVIVCLSLNRLVGLGTCLGAP